MTAAVAPARAKDEPLEALRGLAAFGVVAWHLLLGFAPARPGILPGTDRALSWIGMPWYGLVNGGAAVAFFFVLSGFVLTRQALRLGDGGILARSAVKRWPRLAAPVVISCLVSWALFAGGLYHHAEVGARTGSPWLAAFAYAVVPPDFAPRLPDALAQGLFWTFLRGDASYNSSLWTMHYEFLGSFIAFALALAMLRAGRGSAHAALAGSVGLLMIGLQAFWLAAFPLGVGLAAVSAAGRMPRIGRGTALGLVAAAILLAGYAANSGLGRWSAGWLGMPLPEPLAHGFGAVLLLAAVEGCPALRRPLSGPLARWLGRMSFPVYLLHIPVLCSAGCAAFLALGGGRVGTLGAVLVTLGVTLALATPMARFDGWWTAQLRRLHRPATGRRAAQAAPWA